MSWLTLLFAIELGFMPMNNWVQNESLPVVEDTGYYTMFETQVTAWVFFAGGRVETYMSDKAPGYSFDPLQVTYDFEAGITAGPIELGFRHVCGPHPVRTYPTLSGEKPVAPFEGAYNQIYLRLEKQL